MYRFLNMKTCSVQCGILICTCMLILMALMILYSSNDTHVLLELVHNELSQSKSNQETKFRNGVDTNAILIFKDEFTYHVPEMTSLHNYNNHVRVKRDNAGIIRADKIQANKIKTNKIFAKHVTADIVKAERVKAIIISIGKAFSIHKANRPRDKPETLILERDGPDPTDSAVTILLEREHKPVSINGHPLYEKERQTLLNIRKSFVRNKSKSKTRNEGKPSRNAYVKPENRKTKIPHSKKVSESGKITMTALQKKNILMAHWKNKMINFQKQKALTDRIAMENRLLSTVQIPDKAILRSNVNNNKLVIKKIKIQKPRTFLNTITRPATNAIPWKRFPRFPYIKPLIKKADDSLHMDSDTDESPEIEFNSFENEIEVDIKNKNEKSDNLQLKTFERTWPSFTWSNDDSGDDFFYESDESGVYDIYESSDEKETYGVFDQLSDDSSEYEYYSYENSNEEESGQSGDEDSNLMDSASIIDSDNRTHRIQNDFSYEGEGDSLYHDRDSKESTKKRESQINVKVSVIPTTPDRESNSHRIIHTSSDSVPKGNARRRETLHNTHKLNRESKPKRTDSFFSESAEDWFNGWKNSDFYDDNERDNSDFSGEFSTEEIN